MAARRDPATPPAGTPAVPEGLGNVLFDTWLVSRTVTTLIDEAVRGSGLDADELAVYSVLSVGPMRPGDLAVWMAAPPTTVSSYVKRFERRGHVRRLPDPDDRRSYRIELTAAGHEAHRVAGAAFRPVLGEVADALGVDDGEVRQRLLHLREAVDDVRRQRR